MCHPVTPLVWAESPPRCRERTVQGVAVGDVLRRPRGLRWAEVGYRTRGGGCPEWLSGSSHRVVFFSFTFPGLMDHICERAPGWLIIDYSPWEYKQSTVGLGVYCTVLGGLAFIFTPSIQRWQITIHTSYKLRVLILFFKLWKHCISAKELENIYLTLSQWLNRMLHNYFNGVMIRLAARMVQ